MRIHWHFTRRVPEPTWEGAVLTSASPSYLSIGTTVVEALEKATGTTLCAVVPDGEVVPADVGRRCTRLRVLARADVGAALESFARRCALDVVSLWTAPATVVRYLDNGDPSLLEEAVEAIEARDAPESRSGASEAAFASAVSALSHRAPRDAFLEACEARLCGRVEGEPPREVMDRVRSMAERRLVSLVTLTTGRSLRDEARRELAGIHA